MRAIALLAVVAGCGRPAVGYLHPSGGDDGRTGLGQLGDTLSQAMRSQYRRQIDQPPAPIRLVPSDGSELELRALDATVAIDGPLAHTELRFTFHNGEKRVREGRFSIALPPDAAVARFAMKVDGAWRTARVVSREQGRKVYETFLKTRVDPALLERDLGNQFSARVFPIAALEDKEIILAYEHRVSDTQPYTLALRGLPAIPQLRVAVSRDGTALAADRHGRRLERTNEVPDDIVIDASATAAIAAGDAFVARISASAALEADPLDRVLVLVDTSASRATVMGRQAEVVRKLVAAMPASATVTVAAFDHDTTVLYKGAAGSFDKGSFDRLYAHGALGASDVAAALRRAVGSGETRLVIVGDGAPTIGEHDAGRLAALVAGSKIERIDAIQVGQSIDRDTLVALVRAGARPGAILDGRDPARAARQLAIAMPPEEVIKVDGAVATWPATTRGIAPGEPIWVFGLHPKAADRLTVRIGDRSFPVASKAAGDAKRVRRAVAAAELDELTGKLAAASADDRATFGARIEKLALEHGLVSARTSLLVLENDADEERMLGKAGAPPVVDQGLTKQGTTPTDDFARNVSFSGSTSLDNTYILEGINTTVFVKETDVITGGYVAQYGRAGKVRQLPASSLQHRELVGALQNSAFSLGEPTPASEPKPRKYAAPYTGTLNTVMTAIRDGERGKALELAGAWQLANPGDLAALIALGEALEARGAATLAARAYASIIDLYPSRAELVRAAGERLDRLAAALPAARALSIDAYRRAIHERSDHPSTYRLLAFALVRDGRSSEALDALDEGSKHATRQSVLQVLAEDASLIAAHLVAQDPGSRAAIEKRVRGKLPAVPSLRIVLSWETDANDVDLHVHDRRGNHAFYEKPEMSSGGRLREDLTDGYGPELFAVDSPYAFPYQVGAHYYARGPMGIGLGTVQVIRHDGRGHLAIEDRPFVIQNDDALVDLGVIKGT